MPRYRHMTAWAVAGAAATVLLLVVVVLVLTRTSRGVEVAGQYVVERLRGSVHGELEVVRVRSRGLFRGVTLDGVRITGPDGRLFLQADSARLAYDIRTLLGGDISFNRLTLYRPEIHVERLPGVDRWNFQIIFPDDPDAAPSDNIVLLEDVTLHDGYVAVRIPWTPREPIEPEDTARLLLEEVPGGIVRTVRFEELSGRLPQILWQAPEAEGRVIHIERLAGLAYIWETPADVRDLRGTLTVRDSIIAFRTPYIRLPESELSALGQLVLGQEFHRYDIEAEGQQLALRDFQWLYPQLPDDGGGALRLRMQTQERENILWLASDARIRTGGSELAGSFGVVTGDTLYFANVSLRASPLDVELIRRLLPVDVPVDGLLMGTVEVDGPISALRTRGDLRHRGLADGATAESAVRWTGTVRAAAPWGVSGLEAQLRHVDLGHVAALAPGLRVRGVASGKVSVDGSVDAGFDIAGELSLDQSGTRSAIRGGGRFLSANGSSALDVHFDAEPVALTLISQQYPSLTRLAGHASGPVRLAGTLADLRVDADLHAPSGDLHLDGRIELDAAGPQYVTRGRMDQLRLDQLVDGIPTTSLTGEFELQGGLGPLHELDGRISVELTSGQIAGVEIQGGRLLGVVTDGLARIDTLTVTSPMGHIAARGTLGLAPEREGRLSFNITAETLAPLEPYLFPRTVPDDAALAGPRIDAAFTASGTVTGSVTRWQAQTSVRGEDLVYGDLSMTAIAGRLAWGDDGVDLELRGDSLRAWNRLVPAVRTTFRYDHGSGHVLLSADGRHGEALEAGGRFRWLDAGVVLHLDDFGLSTADGRWQLERESVARVARDGLSVEGLVVRRAPGDAELRVTGVLPWRRAGAGETLDATFAIDLVGIPVDEIARLAQTERNLDGIMGGRLRVTGSALEPVLEGVVHARPFRYQDAALDSIGGWAGYQDQLLTGSIVGWRDGRAILAADAAIPVDLGLTPRPERLLDRPVHVGIRADGMPAPLAMFLLPGMRDVDGILYGSMRLAGSARSLAGNGTRPTLEGELRLLDGTALVEPLNVRFSDIVATARMGDGSIVHLEATVGSDNGTARISGSLDMDKPSDPAFDLRLSARRLDASRRRDVAALADADVHLGGRYTRPVLSGEVRLISGEMNLDEVLRQYQIVQLDASLFQIFDAASIAYRVNPANPFIGNLALAGLTVTADRNFWLRSTELNVEVAGSLDMALDRQFNDIRLTGTMAALRGTYQLQVLERVPTRRFEIREGSIDFAGTPGIDPNLNIIAMHRVRRAQGDPLDVVATVTGTLQSPRVHLTSDSDPPVSENDIASFLLFGRSTLELSQSESDVVASMREGMLGLARPIFLGLASTQLQQAAANLGLPVDYLALTAPEYGFGDYSQVMSVHGGLGVLQGTQLEAGFYAHRDIFVLGSFTPFARALGTFSESEPLFDPRWGARVEWRFRPTWTLEAYWEDRFVRAPSFSYDLIHDRTVGGLSIFREWGY
jgi:hypothetical protein